MREREGSQGVSFLGESSVERCVLCFVSNRVNKTAERKKALLRALSDPKLVLFFLIFHSGLRNTSGWM